MTDSKPPAKVEDHPNIDRLGAPAKPVEGSFVMTDRASHEAWAALIAKNKTAAQVLHVLTAKMGHLNAIVVSQKTLGKMLGVSAKTVQRAVAVLVEDRWVKVVNLNGAGTMPAYLVNDTVAWGESRDKLHLSLFSAAVIADRADQTPEQLADTKLRKIPVLFSNDRQIPTGPGDEPPSQALVPGTEHWLPGIKPSEDIDEAVAQIEHRG